MSMPTILWAVHISDGTLQAIVCVEGLAVTALLMVIGAWRLRDEEVPRIALLTAAFFVASQIHIRLGPTSVHLLLNGLVGIVLGFRAGLAIPIGLLLQAMLFAHGGFFTLGVNACVMTVPAFIAYALYGLLRRIPWREHAWFRAVLVCLTVMGCTFTLVFSVSVLLSRPWEAEELRDSLLVAARTTAHPFTLVIAGALCVLMVLVERRWKLIEFPLGLFLGWFTVLLTVTLNFLVLYFGGAENWTVPALLMYLAHLPLAVLEGVVLGFTMSFLARVKPEMLGLGNNAHYPNNASKSLPL
jgi:cobalt/nickel transport system permease protein